MIKITIEGSSNSGKTLLSMRIAKMLQEEGVEVTLITEPMSNSIAECFYKMPADEMSNRNFVAHIHDTNRYPYDPCLHHIYSFKRKEYDEK